MFFCDASLSTHYLVNYLVIAKFSSHVLCSHPSFLLVVSFPAAVPHIVSLFSSLFSHLSDSGSLLICCDCVMSITDGRHVMKLLFDSLWYGEVTDKISESEDVKFF